MSSPPRWKHLSARIQSTTARSGRAAAGEFSIEGTRLFERALRAEAPLTAALFDASYGKKPRERSVLDELEARGIEMQVMPPDLANSLTAGRTFGTIIGLVTLHQTEECLPATGDLLVAVDVQDPGNVGALIRTAAASGATALIAVGTTDPYHPKAVRTSMGSLFKLNILERSTPQSLWESLRESGHASLAAIPRSGLAPWSSELPAGPHAVLVGSEAHGLPLEVQAACAAKVSLPQRDDLDSYSVNAAAAMLLYELTRRRSS